MADDLIAQDIEQTQESMRDSSEREMYKAKCTDCGAQCEVPFKPTEGKPVRCQDCFRKNKPKRSFGGGGRSFSGGSGGRSFGGGRDNFRSNREMYDATCAKCNKKCQVPFKPSGNKPVLCKDCYVRKD
ncbi:MAG TPA: CxxC-x17-CxxC domain-containing protein [Candidatus Nanoarchaeia archaeon]|nr:CxxC-x17-CxxC domain-containing protein [Candidatus Nanoarchaeia archaeon]